MDMGRGVVGGDDRGVWCRSMGRGMWCRPRSHIYEPVIAREPVTLLVVSSSNEETDRGIQE